ncbi:hypothetical protein CR513_35850, partial [Mucuna pruriens]
MSASLIRRHKGQSALIVPCISNTNDEPRRHLYDGTGVVRPKNIGAHRGVGKTNPTTTRQGSNDDMSITRNQASSTNEGDEDMLQRLMRTVAQLQARSEEHSRLSAEAETRHRLAEEQHAEAVKMAEQREEELGRQIANLRTRNEQEPEGRGEHVAQPLWKQPFCEEIDGARIPPHFREILVDPFDRTQDPHAHL